MKIRRSCVAGYFYEKDAEALKKEVQACLPSSPIHREEARGIMAPHAGLRYSGAVAGSVYASIIFPDTFILLGPNHTGEGLPFSLSEADAWETPLGRIDVDQELAEELLETIPELCRDEAAHQREHSLEVQLPFIQMLGAQTKIVPIILGFQSVETYCRFGEALSEVVQHFPRKLLIVASSDMTHYEPHEIVQKKDAEAIESILALDEMQLMKRVQERNISMCGYAPTVSMLTCLKQLGATRGRLVKYQTSGERSGDYRAVVGYAGIVIQ